jgi:predicted RNase H-like nuclease
LPEAQALGACITIQALNILPKIAEVDAAMTPALATRVHEVHPELAFMALNDGVPVAEPKRSPEGRALRIALLEAAGEVVPPKPRGAAMDDLLDACALRWSARRIADGAHATVLPEPDRDAQGLPMQISW